MSESSSITCPNCGKQYKWKPQLAGKKTQCSGCQQKLRIPVKPDDPVEAIGGLLKDQSHESEGAYELAFDDDQDKHLDPNAGRSKGGQSVSKAPPPMTPDNCPACNTRLKPGAVICINCGYNVAEGKKLQTNIAKDTGGADDAKGGGAARPAPDLGAYSKAAQRTMLDADALAIDQERDSHRKDVVIPLILLGIGVVGLLANAFGIYRFLFNMRAQRAFELEVELAQQWGTPPPTAPAQMTLIDSMMPLIINVAALVIQLPMFLLAIFLVSKMFGSSFGRIGSALLKMLAIAVFVNMGTTIASNVFQLMMSGMGGMTLGMSLGVNFLIFFPIAMWLYELELMETVTIWFMVFVLPWLLLILGGAVLLSLIM